jgi:hypothetical protein
MNKLTIMARVTQPHDCTSSLWDELKFIPIIGSAAGIEVESFFSPPSLTSRLPIKKIYSTAQAFQTQLPTSTLPKILNLANPQTLPL